MLCRRHFLLAGLAAVAGCGGGRQAPAEPPARLALLVGVTDYAPGLPWQPLAGPANDVGLWAGLLTSRFGFTDDGITCLTAATTPPTRANIKQGFERLAADARPGGHVFILLSGHGTEQLDQVPPDPDDPEPNGMDQVFLPSDAGPPDLRTGTIPNGIIDDELRVWLRAIAATGARVWLVCDCCHAGTMLRSGDEEGVRGVPAARVWPASLIEKARDNAAPALRGVARTSPLKVAADRNIVALYACGPDESTTEAYFPDIEDPGRRKLGVFSHALCSALSRADGPLTCRQLIHKLPAIYEGGPAARVRPTPDAEGDGLDSPLFREAAPATPFVLTRDGGSWAVDAGRLHGLHAGAVLAVEGGGKARITSAGLETAGAEAVEGAWQTGAKARLSECSAPPRPVVLSVGEVPFRPALLKRLAALKNVRVVPPSPDVWRLSAEKGGLMLLGPGDPGPRVPLTGGADGLEAAIARVSRITNLLWLASDQPGAGLGLEIELRKVAGKGVLTGPALKVGEKAKFGGWIRAVVLNKGKKPADVTLLAIDQQYNMVPFLPDPKAPGSVRVAPGAEIGTEAFELTPDEPGRPELVRVAMAAVEAGGDKETDFAWLAGDLRAGLTLPPLGDFLAGAMFGQAPRGLSASARYQLAARSWVIVPPG